MENKITIKFSEELNDIHLESNTPDLDGLIRFVVENKERINVERITVICDDTNFDKKGFSEILKKSIKDFLEKIVLNEKQFKEQIEIIKKIMEKLFSIKLAQKNYTIIIATVIR